MDKEQIAKAAVAASIFALVLAAVFSFWFVLPAMHGSDQAFAQDEGEGAAPDAEAGGGAPGGPPGMEAEGGAGGPGGPPGMGGPEMGMGGPGGPPGMGGPDMGMGGPGMGGGGGGAAAATGAPAPPLEPSRANPFVPLDTPEPEEKFITSQSTYGQDWDSVPIGYLESLPQPQIPSSAPVPIPPNPSASADLVRVSSIVWPAQTTGAGAAGRAFATWEDIDGRTRLAKPGQEIRVDDPATMRSQTWRVISIEPDHVVLRNSNSGETVRKRPEPRSRGERGAVGRDVLQSDYQAAQADDRHVPGTSMQLWQGGAGAAGAGAMGMGAEGAMMGPGAMGGGMEMGMGMGMPGMPGMPGTPQTGRR